MEERNEKREEERCAMKREEEKGREGKRRKGKRKDDSGRLPHLLSQQAYNITICRAFVHFVNY